MSKFYLVAHDDYYPLGGIDDFSQSYDTFADAYLAYVIAVDNRDNCYVVQSQDDVLSTFDIASFERESKHVRTITAYHEDVVTEKYNWLFGGGRLRHIFDHHYFEYITGTELQHLSFPQTVDKEVFVEMIAVIEGLWRGVDVDAPLWDEQALTDHQSHLQWQTQRIADDKYWNGDE